MSASAAWTLLRACRERGEPAALLLVIEAEGASPGRAGFAMAVAQSGELAGTVGGGAMEFRLVERARARLRAGTASAPEVVLQEHHEAAPAGDRSGLICGGRQRVLICPAALVEARALAPLAEARAGWIDVTPERLAFADAPPGPEGFREETGGGWRYVGPAGLRHSVYLIGGGHVAQALSRVLADLEFRIVVIDPRPDACGVAENPWAHEKIPAPFARAAEHVPEGDDVYAVIMTPAHAEDEAALRALVSRRLRYLALLGSTRKVHMLFDRLRKDGVPEVALARVRAPAGVAIGSRTPAEIAVSIAAEMILFRRGGRGEKEKS